jgi:hypothetical protein
VEALSPLRCVVDKCVGDHGVSGVEERVRGATKSSSDDLLDPSLEKDVEDPFPCAVGFRVGDLRGYAMERDKEEFVAANGGVDKRCGGSEGGVVNDSFLEDLDSIKGPREPGA